MHVLVRLSVPPKPVMFTDDYSTIRKAVDFFEGHPDREYDYEHVEISSSEDLVRKYPQEG